VRPLRINPGARAAANLAGGALVTGAGGGLGLEISRRLAARGLSVHLTDIDADKAARAAEDIGSGAWASRLDVRDADDCRRAAQETVTRAGSLEVWVNNAGILPTGHVWDHPEPLRRLTFEVNTLGTINGTLAALSVMREANRGHIINVVSLAGLVAAPGEALYSATKHAALAFSIGALADLRRAGVSSVHVSALCPDGIWTPMLHEKVRDPEAALSWSGVMLDPGRVAECAIGLLDKPRPVLAVPRWRGWAVRVFDATPRLALGVLPLVMALARRKQRAFARTARAKV
jgi:NAD(P)-dependent dehydrogenase (short-subunit alcohol dehydrogenase family)